MKSSGVKKCHLAGIVKCLTTRVAFLLLANSMEIYILSEILPSYFHHIYVTAEYRQ